MLPNKLNNAVLTIPFGEEGKTLDCPVKVADLDETKIWVTTPLDKNSYPMFIAPGTEVSLAYVIDTHLYQFKTKILAPQMRERIPLLELVSPDKAAIRKVQRRQDFRVPVLLSTKASYNGELVILDVRDLSGGGFQGLCPKAKPLRVGDELSGAMELTVKGKSVMIQYNAVVRRSFPDENLGRQVVGAQFLKLPERLHDTILQYCLERQMEMRRKSKL